VRDRTAPGFTGRKLSRIACIREAATGPALISRRSNDSYRARYNVSAFGRSATIESQREWLDGRRSQFDPSQSHARRCRPSASPREQPL